MFSSYQGKIIKVLIITNCIIVICYFVGSSGSNLAETCGKFGLSLGSFVFPGTIIKFVLKVFASPFAWVGKNIKIVLVIDVAFIVMCLLLLFMKRKKMERLRSESSKSVDSKTESSDMSSF